MNKMSKTIVLYESQEIKKTASEHGEYVLIRNYMRNDKGEWVVTTLLNLNKDELEDALKLAKR